MLCQLGTLYERVRKQCVYANPKQHMHSNYGGANAEFSRTNDPSNCKSRQKRQQPGYNRFESRPKYLTANTVRSQSR